MLSKFQDIRKSERLCAVCAAKRLAARFYFKEEKGFQIENNFPSVSMVATASYKLRVIQSMDSPSIRVAVNRLVDSVKNLVGNDNWSGVPVPMVRRACRDDEAHEFARLEGDWLYQDFLDNRKAIKEDTNNRLTPEAFEDLYCNAKECQNRFFLSMRDFEAETGKYIGSPSRYYAIIHMDGDNMGKWLSGEYAPLFRDILHPIVRNSMSDNFVKLTSMPRPLNPSLHLAASKALRDFSLHVTREIVEKDHIGKLVYAGGDDVLAFVNLKDLLDVMRKLRAYFSGSIKIDPDSRLVDIDHKDGSGYIPVDGEGNPVDTGNNKQIKGLMLSMGTNATASMGVVIAHHSDNLSQLLEQVRNCERKAKEIAGKDAFCIALAKRAGGTEFMSVKWYTNEGTHETIPLLKTWVKLFAENLISPKVVYTIRKEGLGLEGLPLDAIKTEFLRITNRQRNKQAKEFTGTDLMNLVERTMNLVSGQSGGFKYSDLGAFLSVAAFLGREGNR